MRFNFCTGAIIATTATTISTAVVNANRNIFGISSRSKRSIFGGQQQLNSNSIPITTLPRGGATAELIGEVVDEPEPLYLPGLLEASIPSKSSNTPTSALSDYTISISSSKAKELNVKNGEIVAIIGRRRRVSYGTVQVSKMKNGSVKLSNNLANNLRVLDTDKVKIVPLNSNENEGEENESESYTLGNPPSDIAHSVTFAPIRDSLHTLELKERGGDEFSDEEISERFVVPYLNMDEDDGNDGNSVVVLREGHTLVLKDDNGVSLEFMVSHLDLVGDDDDSENEESVVAESGKFLF